MSFKKYARTFVLWYNLFLGAQSFSCESVSPEICSLLGTDKLCTNIYAPVVIYLLTSQTIIEFLVSSSYNRTQIISKYPAFYFIKKLNASLAFKSFRREAKGLCKNMAKQIDNYRSQLTIIHQSRGVNIYHSSSTLR